MRKEFKKIVTWGMVVAMAFSRHHLFLQPVLTLSMLTALHQAVVEVRHSGLMTVSVKH